MPASFHYLTLVLLPIRTINRSKLSSLDVDFNQAMTTISDLAGGNRVNQTSIPGGIRDVQIVSDSRGRRDINDLLNYSVRSKNGDMVKVRQFANAEFISAPPKIDHFSFNRSVKFLFRLRLASRRGK